MNQIKKLDFSDWLGASASGLCLVHCALTPLIFTVKPAFYGIVGEHVHGHGLWAGLDYVFLILSLVAVWFSSEHTTHSTLKWGLWVSWVTFAIGLFFEPLESFFGHCLMYTGSILLVIAHITNYYHCNATKSSCQTKTKME